jgi:type II secretory pathway component GspD/PulD (secretin)
MNKRIILIFVMVCLFYPLGYGSEESESWRRSNKVVRESICRHKVANGIPVAPRRTERDYLKVDVKKNVSPRPVVAEKNSKKEEDSMGDIAKEMYSFIEEGRSSMECLPPLVPKEEVSSYVSVKDLSPLQLSKRFVPPQALGKRISLEFDAVDLENVLRTVSETVGVNIIVDPAIKDTKVNLHLKDIPVEEAVGLLFRAYDLNSYQVGKSHFISTHENIKKEKFMTKVIKLKNLDVEEIEGLIKDLVETINISKKTNTIVVVGTPDDIVKVENIVKKVDKPQAQVVLEAKIIEIDKEGLKEIGIDWSDSITTFFQEGKRTTTLDAVAASVGTSPFHVYRLSRSAAMFNTVLNMLESQDKAEVLSSPHVATLNNKESEIFVGDEVPYTVTTISGGTSTTEVRFAEAGIKLKITPSIIEEDFVVIKIEPEVSYIFTWRGPDDQYPWIKTRKAVAHVRVKNNQPFIMGGLLTKEDKSNIDKVPFMGDLPFFGKLFRNERRSTEDSELVIGIIPKIIYGDN